MTEQCARLSVEHGERGNSLSSPSGIHQSIDLPFWRKYLFSTDHKVIGVQYALTAMFFLLFGFGLMLLMRWQLAFPGRPIPLIGGWFGEESIAFPDGILSPEFYNSLGAMHGTIMVFLGVVPLAVGAFGNYLIPLQIGAPDMAFPKLNMASYWCFLAGGVVMLGSFFLPAGPATSGVTPYPPVSVAASGGPCGGPAGTGFLRTHRNGLRRGPARAGATQ